ncbi:hypothetical protein KP79_PYT12682 [Mizuhopecten yessoensis]|uniref:Uncharacterized protein n=1 Tax=Mizuhopecten yessoensis TaxID=6573 RepID=A0A210PLD6_MIZYE|nr:hypothetical protein KP79_PYT12682 [Mizuhopecten yessoensis]
MASARASERGPASVEPEPGYAPRLFHYFTASGIEKVCPAPADLIRRIGNEVFCILLSKLLALLLGYVPSIGNIAREKWSAMVSMFQGWRARPSRCRHCGTTPCQVKMKCLWMPSGPRKRSKANFTERSKAMMLFSYGLELSVQLTKELPQDDLYWQRKFCDQFEEKHMVLFPLCIQRQVNLWYPVPP